MKDFFGVEINTENMTLEELEDAQAKTRSLLFELTYQVNLRKMAKNQHFSDTSPR